MGLTNYEGILQAGVKGALVHVGDRSGRVISRKNEGLTANVWTVTPSAVNSAVYTLTVDGFTASYTADGSATVAEITAGIKLAVDRTYPEVGALVTITDNTTTYTVTARQAGVTLALSVDANQSAVEATAAATGTAIPVGIAVMDLDGSLCRMPASDGGALKIMTGLAVAVNAAIYNLDITLEDGRGYSADYTADGSATATEIGAALVASLNAKLPASTVLAEAATGTITLTSEVAGQNFNAVFGSNSDTGTWTVTVTTANADPATTYPLAGVVVRDENLGIQTAGSGVPTTVIEYPALRSVAIAQRREVFVQCEDAVNPTLPVFVRTTASATYGKGSLRGTTASGATITWSGARWTSTTAAGGIAQLYVP